MHRDDAMKGINGLPIMPSLPERDADLISFLGGQLRQQGHGLIDGWLVNTR
jgi:hypothetical protein